MPADLPGSSVPAPPAPAGPGWLAGSSPRARAMSEALRARLCAFSPDVSELIRRRHAAYCVHGRPFAYAFPHGARIRVVLNLKSLDDPEGSATCIAGRCHEGQGDWQIDVFDGRDLEHAMPLLRQAFEAALRRR